MGIMLSLFPPYNVGNETEAPRVYHYNGGPYLIKSGIIEFFVVNKQGVIGQLFKKTIAEPIIVESSTMPNGGRTLQ